MASSSVRVPVVILLTGCSLLTGCGVAETGAAAAAAATAKAQEAHEGLKTEARVREQLDAAAKASADQRNAAEAATQ
jgi:alpha-D-ribose 1-methylphosphonate 5-triphosphate synthase subunit PhnG